MEDLIFMFEKQGIRTGVDLELYREARRIAEQALPDESFYGTIFRAGVPKGFKPATQRMAAE